MEKTTATACLLMLSVICLVAAAQHSGNSTESPGDTLAEGTTQSETAYGEILVDAITVLKCINFSQNLQYSAESGVIHMNSTSELKRGRSCTISVSARDGKVLQFSLPPFVYKPMMLIALRDDVAKKQLRIDRHNPPYAFTTGNGMTLLIRHSYPNKYFVPINFTFVSLARQPQMEVHYLTDTSGFILSPLWDDHSPFALNLDSWKEVRIPEGLGMMMSFGQVYLSSYAKLAIYQAGRDPAHLVTLVHKPQTPIPTSTYNQTIHLHFQSGIWNGGLAKGFRLLFTLHPLPTLLKQVREGVKLVKDRFGYDDFYDKSSLWNCSVSSWEDYLRHFPCNFMWNCVLGEDEERCPYANADLCGPGQLWTNDSCHRLFTSPATDFWKESGRLCSQYGGQLSSLNTPYEWEMVTRYIHVPSDQSAFFGLSSFPVHANAMYDMVFQWEDKTTAFYIHGVSRRGTRTYRIKPFCGALEPDKKKLKPLQGVFRYCFGRPSLARLTFATLCEFKLPQTSKSNTIQPPVLSLQSNIRFPASHVTCISEELNAGHVTHAFLACDPRSKCLRREECQRHFDLPLPSFLCSNEREEVPYTLVCDHREDCTDKSDENFCVFPPCDSSHFYSCGDGQCINQEHRCDVLKHCVSGSDENYCFPTRSDKIKYYSATFPPPALVDMDHRGLLVVKPLRSLNYSTSCPSSHFQCHPPNNYCLPIYLRCNQVQDCLEGEDEADCNDYACPGYYRCRGSPICLHADHVCDHIYGQCPQNDDELLCDFSCPLACQCFGMAFYCNQSVDVSEYQDLRFLNADGSNMTLMDLGDNTMLIHVSLAGCSMHNLQAPDLPNLKSLDLSNNLISNLLPKHFANIKKLTALSLAGNPLHFQSSIPAISAMAHLRTLDLSYVSIVQFNVSDFEPLSHLHTLNLSHSSINHVANGGFQALKVLRSVDLWHCQVEEFPPRVFDNLVHLESVISSNYKLCCPAVLPTDFNPHRCHAPTDSVSSCDNLLKNSALRALLFLIAAMSLSGNLLALVYWTLIQRHFQVFGCGVFMIHLCVSDFFMGAYLMTIVVADRVLQGSYMWEDVGWRQSVVCTCAGMLFVLSLLVSMFLICVMTTDRIISLFTPFIPFHFAPKSAHAVSASIWVFGLVLAAIPLSPAASLWQFYNKSAVCVPLPPVDTTHTGLPFQWREAHNGQFYYIGIFYVLNVIVCLLVAVGQGLVFWTLSRTMVLATDCSRKMQELLVARRMINVIVPNFVGWFLSAVFGLLAVTDVSIPSEVRVFMTVLVLSVSSSLSPVLYTMTVIMEDRKKAREQLLLTILARQKGRQQHAKVKSGNKED